MFRAFAMTLALVSLSVGARAATAPVWQGEGFITGITGACTPTAVATVGDFYRMVYRPKIASTDPADGLSFVGSRSAYLVISKAGGATLQGTGTYGGTYISSHAGTGGTTGSFSLSISPSPVTKTTGTVTISGTITNFFATTGCDITFRSAYTPRVD